MVLRLGYHSYTKKERKNGRNEEREEGGEGKQKEE